MYKHIASVGGMTLLSRMAGFVRDVLMAAILGAGPVADAFVIAFRLPNHFRSLFAEGAFNAAFVPQFTGHLVRDGLVAAARMAEDVLSLLIASQLLLLGLALVFMPVLITLLAPGFGQDPAQFELAVELTRITFPYLLFITLVSLFGAMLNALNRFWAAAAAPILLNLFMIAALLWLVPRTPTAGHALAWGVMLSGIAQFLLLAWDARAAGLRLRLKLPRLTRAAIDFLKVLGPATIGAGVVQISLFADTIIASMLPAGGVSALYYADRLNQLPLGVIGIAIGTVLLPDLARRLDQGDRTGALHVQNRAIELSLVLTLPCAVAFAVVAEPIVAALFERGQFDAAATAASSATLSAYALGLPAFVLIRSALPGFHARSDTATPVKIAAVAVAVNVTLKLVLVGSMAQVGLAIATSVGAWINWGLLIYVLVRRGQFELDQRSRRTLPRILASAILLAAALLGADRLLGDRLGSDVAFLAALIAVGAIAYPTVLFATRATTAGDLRRLLGRS